MTPTPDGKFRADGLRSRLAAALPLAVAVASLVAVHALGSRAALLLRYQRTAIVAGQWWRLLTAHLVHEDPRHLALNVAGLVAIWMLYRRDAREPAWLIATLVSALGVGLGLLAFEPQLDWYEGLSGVLHGLWAAGAVFAWRRWRAESIAALALLGAKLVLELWHGGTILDPSLSLPVITAAHRYGALSGLVASLALRRASL